MPAPGNPAHHQFPGDALSLAQMHHELTRDVHADCTLQTCEMLRGCWIVLTSLGHPHPFNSPDECPQCSEPTPDSP